MWCPVMWLATHILLFRLRWMNISIILICLENIDNISVFNNSYGNNNNGSLFLWKYYFRIKIKDVQTELSWKIPSSELFDHFNFCFSKIGSV